MNMLILLNPAISVETIRDNIEKFYILRYFISSVYFMRFSQNLPIISIIFLTVLTGWFLEWKYSLFRMR
jgi:hypothetical protein